jgi:hypothetical protein
LLDLEEYLAALVDGVVRIVDSAGSICELGAFVKTPEISKKLVIVISNFHYNEISFIKMGPLKYFEEMNENDAEIDPFHWNEIDGGVQVDDYVLEGIITDLRDSIEKVRPKGRISKKNLGDRIFFTLSICHLCRGAKLSELKECYQAVDMQEYEKELVKHLSVLEICKLIKPISHGKKNKYFVPLIESLPIKVSFKPEANDRDRDTLRWIGEISALIAKHEPTRMKIFQEHQHGA